MCFEKFFDSHMWNYIGKLKMITWNRFDTKCEMNELLLPTGLASQVLCAMQVGDISLIKNCYCFAPTKLSKYFFVKPIPRIRGTFVLIDIMHILYFIFYSQYTMKQTMNHCTLRSFWMFCKNMQKMKIF